MDNLGKNVFFLLIIEAYFRVRLMATIDNLLRLRGDPVLNRLHAATHQPLLPHVIVRRVTDHMVILQIYVLF